MLLKTNPASSNPQNGSCTAVYTPHFPNHPSNTIKRCWTLLEKQRRTHGRHYLVDSSTWAHRWCTTSKDWHFSALCGYWLYLEDLLGAIADKDWWRESQESPCVIFWPPTKPKNAIPKRYTGGKRHIPMASNRKRSRGRIKAYDMGQGEGPIVPLQWCTGRE